MVAVRPIVPRMGNDAFQYLLIAMLALLAYSLLYVCLWVLGQQARSQVSRHMLVVASKRMRKDYLQSLLDRAGGVIEDTGIAQMAQSQQPQQAQQTAPDQPQQQQAMPHLGLVDPNATLDPPMPLGGTGELVMDAAEAAVGDDQPAAAAA